jgi:hypothetical protein
LAVANPSAHASLGPPGWTDSNATQTTRPPTTHADARSMANGASPGLSFYRQGRCSSKAFANRFDALVRTPLIRSVLPRASTISRKSGSLTSNGSVPSSPLQMQTNSSAALQSVVACLFWKRSSTGSATAGLPSSGTEITTNRRPFTFAAATARTSNEANGSDDPCRKEPFPAEGSHGGSMMRKRIRVTGESSAPRPRWTWISWISLLIIFAGSIADTRQRYAMVRQCHKLGACHVPERPIGREPVYLFRPLAT